MKALIPLSLCCCLMAPASLPAQANAPAAAAPKPAAEAADAKAEAAKPAADASDAKAKEKKQEDEAKAKEKEKAAKEAAEKAKRAALLARTRSSFSNLMGSQVSWKSDVSDNTERVFLFAPKGPIILEMALNVEGKGFRENFNSVLLPLIKSGDKNKDGKLSWEEAIDHPRMRARFRGLKNKQARQNYIRNYDRNGNGMVDAAELGLIFGGTPFTLNSRQFGGQNPQIYALIDSNQDQTLSAEELGKIEERLKTRDADDNDVLDLNELNGNRNVVYAQGAAVRINRGRVAQGISSVLLGPGTNFEQFYQVFKQKYPVELKEDLQEKLPLLVAFIKTLDADKDGKLSQKELEGAAGLKPHIQLQIDFGKEPTVKIVSVADELGKPEMAVSKQQQQNNLPASSITKLTFSGLKLQLGAQDFSSRYNYAERQAEAMIKRIDKDNNGYIEKDELKNSPYKGYLVQFEGWDTDGNGMVYPKELEEWYSMQMAPQRNRIYVYTSEMGRALLSVLDQTGDNRISLREMRQGKDQLKKLDKDGDGEINSEEIPLTIAFGIGRGGAMNLFARRNAIRVVRLGQQNPKGNRNEPGPDWFNRMDRNADGDITLREWLGTPEQFKKLDKNGDGFIELKEAEAAEKERGGQPEKKEGDSQPAEKAPPKPAASEDAAEDAAG